MRLHGELGTGAASLRSAEQLRGDLTAAFIALVSSR